VVLAAVERNSVKIQSQRRSIKMLAVVAAFVSMAPLWVLVVIYVADWMVVAVAIAASVIIAFVASEVMFYKVDDALQRVEKILNKIASGDLSARAYKTDQIEVSPLVKSVNTMATAVQRSVGDLKRSSAEHAAILRTMVEGVITIDPRGEIRAVNDAAISLLDMERIPLEGKRFDEVISHTEVRHFVATALESSEYSSATVSIRGEHQRLLELSAAPLLSYDLLATGTLVVIHDVTRLEKLENIRRDFVANVSHELRTPITSIKGFVETLIDGAMHDGETLRKFLGIIAKQADRLNSIFNDLLTLARLESGGDDTKVETEVKSVRDIARIAVEECSRRAHEKGIDVSVDIAPELLVQANSSLVEQALVNLVDNAIKYSESGASVRVQARKEDDQVEIIVEDTGPGIEDSHLARLFERFYRIDQGRSRALGGTGLGLAIVKHIAQVHGGKVAVSSLVGQGSSFSIFLPAA